MKSGCSGPYPVKLEVFLAVQISLPSWATRSHSSWTFIFPNYNWEFPALQLLTAPSSRHHAPLKRTWLFLPYSLPADRIKSSLLSAFPSPGWTRPALAASPCTPSVPALSSMATHCWILPSTSTLLWYWGAPVWATVLYMQSQQYQTEGKKYRSRHYANGDQPPAWLQGASGPANFSLTNPKHILKGLKPPNNCRNC